MRPLPPDRDPIVERFASLFGDSVWPRARTLLIGAMLVPGRRTVASALRVIGACRHHRLVCLALASGGVTFAEARRHLGVESQRQCSEKAIGRTTPVLTGLFSLVTLLADRLTEGGAVPRRTSAWYRKRRASFSDALALVRRELWAAEGFSMSASREEIWKIRAPLMARLSDALCHAA